MVTYKKVAWTEAARDNLFQIHQRIVGKSLERAQEVTQKILSKTAILDKTYPQGSPEPLLKNEKVPYKFIIVNFYKIIYSVEEEQVLIKTIYHNRQDPVI